jgi:hypothetical protein
LDVFTDENLENITTCNSCPAHAECQKDNVTADPGYWKVTYYDDEIMKCPYGEAACKGGADGGDASCNEGNKCIYADIMLTLSYIFVNVLIGYTGPFCGVCAENYYYDSFTQLCTICEDSGVNPFAIVSIILLSLLAFAVGMYFVWDTVLHMLGFKIRVGTFSSNSYITSVVASGLTNFQNKLKLLASMFQILTGLPSVLVLVFPAVYSSILSIFSIVSQHSIL